MLTFARVRPLAPRAAIAVALLPVLGWIAGLAFAAAIPDVANPATLLPLGIASLFELFGAAMLGRTLRAANAEPPVVSTHRYLLGVALGALVTAALVTPALAAAQNPAYQGTGIELPTHHGP